MAFDLIQFTDQLRYLPYADWSEDYQEKLATLAATSPWHTTYHIEPQTGLLNDPNGFSYYQGRWQLFYQYYPFGPVHGLKSWFRLSSSDLFHWEREGIALQADTPFDSHGAYSGSALATERGLFTFYTGNVRDAQWQRTPYQNGAWMTPDGHMEKLPQPLITPPDFVTDHFRDPNIFQYQGTYYALLGAQLKEGLRGVILLYEASADLMIWTYRGILDIGETTLGYMVECPAIAFVEEQPILLFCPQGLPQEVSPYQNIYPNKYIIGERFDPQQVRIVNPTPMRNLDEGFDYYAATTANGAHDEALSVAWLGLPEISYPTDDYGYQGALSLVRTLSIKDRHLYQTPVMDETALSATPLAVAGQATLAHNHYWLGTTVAANAQETLQLFMDDEGLGLNIQVDSQAGTVTLDRSQTHYPVGEAYGTTRVAQLAPDTSITLDVYVDMSLVEIFINGGACTLTGRYFPTPKQTGVVASHAKVRYIK